MMDMCGGRDLSTLSSAQMSMPYAVALAWVFGDAGLARYLAPARRDARLAAAMSLVHLHADPAMPALEEPTVTITSTGGETVSLQVPLALGAPANPLDDGCPAAQVRRARRRGAAGRRRGHARRIAAAPGPPRRCARALLPLLAGQAALHELLC